MRVLKAELENLEEVAVLFDLYRQFYKQKPNIEAARDFIRHRLHHQESVILIVETEGRYAGFTQLFPSYSSVSMMRIWILNDLYVHPDFRRQGVAEQLIEGAKYLVRETASKGLSLETEASNTQAQQLYDKTGFLKETNHFYHWRNDKFKS